MKYPIMIKKLAIMSNFGGDFITHMKNFAAIVQLPTVTSGLEIEKWAPDRKIDNQKGCMGCDSFYTRKTTVVL